MRDVSSQKEDTTGSPNPPPEPVGFRPEPAGNSEPVPEPLGFRHDRVHQDSVICRPLAVFACRAMVEKNGDRTPEEVDLVVEDLPLCTGLGRAQVVGEHLDSVLTELRELCGMQRQIALDEAAQGHDCQVEAQELNRLVELEEDVARELLAFRGEPMPEPDANGSQLEPEKLYRICSLQSDVGGGCESGG